VPNLFDDRAYDKPIGQVWHVLSLCSLTCCQKIIRFCNFNCGCWFVQQNVLVGSRGRIKTCSGIVMVGLSDWFCISKFLIQMFFCLWDSDFVVGERLLFCGYIRERGETKSGGFSLCCCFCFIWKIAKELVVLCLV
jgi:hypothetical protein